MSGLSNAILISLIVCLCGCAKCQTPNLGVAMGLTEDEWQIMREEIFPVFEQRFGCIIKPYQIESADLIKKLTAMVKAKRVKIDVFSQDNMRLYALVNEGLVEDLSAYKRKIPSAISHRMQGIGNFKNRTYFFPYRPNVQITYYNEERFKYHNLRPPRTWEELMEVAQAFKEKEGLGKIGLKLWGGSPTAAQIYEMIISAGGDPFSFNDAGCIKTFEFLKALYPYLASDSKKAKWDTTITYLANQSFYLAQNWPFSTNILIKEYDKHQIKAYSGWSGPLREAHVIGGEVLGIPKAAKNKRLALEFILFLESKEIQEKLANKLGWPSVRYDAYAQIPAWQEPYFKATQEALRHGVYRPNVSYWDDFEKFINEAVTRIVINQEECLQVLNEYHEKMKKIKTDDCGCQ